MARRTILGAGVVVAVAVLAWFAYDRTSLVPSLRTNEDRITFLEKLKRERIFSGWGRRKPPSASDVALSQAIDDVFGVLGGRTKEDDGDESPAIPDPDRPWVAVDHMFKRLNREQQEAFVKVVFDLYFPEPNELDSIEVHKSLFDQKLSPDRDHIMGRYAPYLGGLQLLP